MISVGGKLNPNATHWSRANTNIHFMIDLVLVKIHIHVHWKTFLKNHAYVSAAISVLSLKENGPVYHNNLAQMSHRISSNREQPI